jgi:hypothetical protein
VALDDSWGAGMAVVHQLRNMATMRERCAGGPAGEVAMIETAAGVPEDLHLKENKNV